MDENLMRDEIAPEFIHLLEEWARSSGRDMDNFLKQFENLSCSDEKIRQAIFDEAIVNCFRDRIKTLLNCDDQKNSKNDEQSKKLRLQGNQFYSQKKPDLAHQFYTQAIKVAPINEPSSENLALSYANRSAVNFEMEDYEAAIHDIDAAIKNGYPTGKIDKLLQRKAKCLAKLEMEKVSDISEPKLSSNGGKVLHQMVEVEVPTEMIHSGDSNDENDPEPQIDVHNPLLPCASAKVKVKYDPKKGRGLVAQDRINFGDILVVEDPYSHILFTESYENFCKTCCQTLEGFTAPCFNCSVVQYCSEKCRDDDSIHRSYTCFPSLPHTSDSLSQLVLRMMVRSILIDESTEMLKVTQEQEQGEDLSQQVYQSNYSSILKLIYPPVTFSELILPSLYVAILVELIHEIAGKEVSVDLGCLARIVLIHFHQMLVNKAYLVHNIDEINFSSSSFGEQSEKIGLAIYPTMSLINHSCKPNVFLFFHHGKAIVRACRPIDRGEEVYLCYGPSLQQDTLKDRQVKLKEWYYFECECDACSKKLESPRIAYKCPQCNGALMVNSDGTNHCLNCRVQDLNISGRVNKIKFACQEKEKGMKAMELANYDEAIQYLSRSYNAMDDNLYRTNWMLLQSRSSLCECLAMMEHFEMAHKLSKMNVNAARDIHGLESVEFVTHMITYLSLRFKDIEEVAADDRMKAITQAQEVCGLVEEELARLDRLASIGNTNENEDLTHDRKVFDEEINSLMKIRNDCRKLIET